MRNQLFLSPLLVILLAGCGGGASVGGKEATLAEMNRAVSTVSMLNGGRLPESVDAITNLLSQQGLRLPTPPAGKKLYDFIQPFFANLDLVCLTHDGREVWKKNVGPLDLHYGYASSLCLADGNSAITEKVFPDRFIHVAELLRMGANIRKEGSVAIVTGVKQLIGAPVMASDLRASAALVIAGLAAKGTTQVNRVYHIDRGYENLDGKLRRLGARIQRVPEL